LEGKRTQRTHSPAGLCAAKKRLLAVYANRHAAGEIAEDHMDHRAIWMFAQPELADAIRQADYLRTPARRCGILVITHHGNRTWRAQEDNAVVTFDALIDRLRSMARTITSNATGPVRAEVVGIDTTKAQ